MNNCRLNEDELLDKSHLPVLMMMNMISEKRFLTVLEAISQGNGFGVDGNEIPCITDYSSPR